MHKINRSKYVKMYKEKILPKKTVTTNSLAVHDDLIDLMNQTAPFRDRANEVIFSVVNKKTR